jgi:hypothetical protein
MYTEVYFTDREDVLNKEDQYKRGHQYRYSIKQDYKKAFYWYLINSIIIILNQYTLYKY